MHRDQTWSFASNAGLKFSKVRVNYEVMDPNGHRSKFTTHILTNRYGLTFIAESGSDGVLIYCYLELLCSYTGLSGVIERHKASKQSQGRVNGGYD